MERENRILPRTDVLFLRIALSEGAHLKPPPGISEEKFVRRRNIVGSYHGTQATLAEIGEIYGLTGEWVRQLDQEGLFYLWQNCSPQTQELFPFSEISRGKPRSQKTRERSSLAFGGASLQVAATLKDGKKRSFQQLSQETGISPRRLTNLRRRLKAWNLEIPYERPRKYQLIKDLQRAKDPRKVQMLLNQVTHSIYDRNVRDIPGTKPLFVSLKRVVTSCRHPYGGNASWSWAPVYAKALKDLGIPVGEINHRADSQPKPWTQRCFFLLAREQDRARQVLLDPNFERFLEQAKRSQKSRGPNREF